jgi:hypothetical protein
MEHLDSCGDLSSVEAFRLMVVHTEDDVKLCFSMVVQNSMAESSTACLPYVTDR